MPISHGAKLIVVVIVGIIDIANYWLGADLYSLRDEQLIGTILTLILMAAGMVMPSAAPAIR